jgi:lactate dehydrogenase-like 2-hydroxyacid dehydrogenase
VIVPIRRLQRNAVSEQTVALFLNMARMVPRYDAELKDGRWTRHMVHEIGAAPWVFSASARSVSTSAAKMQRLRSGDRFL